VPYGGPLVTDPRHFIQHQDKYQYPQEAAAPGSQQAGQTEIALTAPVDLTASGGAQARHKLADKS
jgi:hypothetical protein